MKNILDYILYLIPIILIMVVINIILAKKKVNSSYRYLINGITLILLALTINNYCSILECVFSLKFLSVKFYIIILIITNVITLITIKKNISNIYKIINYILFGLMTIMLIAILVIIAGVKLEIISSSNNEYTVILLNVSIISFIAYIIVISITYILKSLNSIKLKKVIHKKINISKEVIIEPVEEQTKILSPEELLSLENKKEFSINEVECSIIFEDSIPENIVKNYHILLNDINDKLVNGYTLEENKLLKSICAKLKTNNLAYIDLNNLSILNKISVEEYNFLKQIYSE